jgi:hypothetical protein
MAESPTRPSESQRDANRMAVTIKQVVIYYSAVDEHGTMQDLRVEIDPAKADAVVWNPAILEEFKKDRTRHNDPPKRTGELPDPVPDVRKSLNADTVHSRATAPEGTCCFVNGRWVCW